MRIKITEDYTLTKDKYQYILVSRYTGFDAKTKEDKDMFRQTYHGSIPQVAKFILDQEGEKCTSIYELSLLYTKGIEQLSKEITNAVNT